MSDPPLHTLQVFETPDGGLPEHVRQLARGLLERGHRVTVAGPAGGAPREWLESHGVPYHVLPIVGEMLAPPNDAATLRRLLSLMREGRFDLAHLHGQKPGLLGRLAATATRTPAIYTPNALPHRFMFVKPFPKARSRYLKTLWMERVLGRLTAAFIAVSDEERRGVIADRLLAARRVHLIHNGVSFDETAVADPRLTAFRGDGPLLGIVAGLRDQKGLPTLLDSLELLATSGSAPRFAIVGNGPLEAEVRARVARGPLRETTLVLPYDGHVEPYLKALDAYVLPSYWEGLPLAVLEAMAAGLPVVGSAAGGTPEAVLDRETGLIVGVDDHLALADALQRVGSDATLRARLGAAARERYLAHFTVDRMVGETEALYRDVAAGGRRARDR